MDTRKSLNWVVASRVAVAVAFLFVSSVSAMAQAGQSDLTMSALAHLGSSPRGTAGGAIGGGVRFGYERALGAGHPWAAIEAQYVSVGVALRTAAKQFDGFRQFGDRWSVRALAMQPQASATWRRHVQGYLGAELFGMDYVVRADSLREGAAVALVGGTNLYLDRVPRLRAFVEGGVSLRSGFGRWTTQAGVTIPARAFLRARPSGASLTERSR